MRYRKFKLKNSLNASWELTETSVKTFLSDPSGLGMSNSIETTQYGNVLRLDNIDTAFPSVSGNVMIYENTVDAKYLKYNQFVTFLTYTPLVLEYQVPGTNKTFYLDVVVASLDKTEVDRNGVMNCPITLQGLGMWRGNSFYWTGNASSKSLTNDGHFPVGLTVTLTGNMTNPYFTLTQNSEVYGEAKFIDTTAFNSVIVDSRDGMQSVELQQSNSVLANPLGYQDLSISNGAIYVTFIKLARGTSTLNVGMDSGSLTSVIVNYTPIYASV